MSQRAQVVLFYTLLFVPVALCWAGQHDVRDLHTQHLRGRAIVHDSSQLSQAYDFIIIGGGTAGLVLASRLSEDSNHTVLVLEAGNTGDDVKVSTDIPGNAFTHSLLHTPYDWGYNTVTQPKANNRQLYWPRGKILGGSSAVNGLYLVRPSKIEYDTWADLMQSQDNGAGAKAWSWDRHFPFMKKTETYTPPVPDAQSVLNVAYNLNNHGTNGPLHASYPGYVLPVVSNWIPTLQNVGIPQSPDPSGGQGWGGFIATSAINPTNWTRSYSRPAYIDPLPPRPNLDILVGVTVTKILFDSNLTATGVQFAVSKDGPVTTINVRMEVLLAAGAIGSPNVLMHSGIGPRDVLVAAGVDVKLDLPGVGQHMQDHISSSVTFKTTAETIVSMLAKGAADGVPPGQSSPFLSFVNSATCYANTSNLIGSYDDAVKFQKTVLDSLDQSVSTLIPSKDPGVIEGYKALYRANAEKILLSPVGQVELLLYATGNFGPGDQTISLQLALQHPYSQGRLYITTNDTFDTPALDPQYLTHPADATLMRQAVRLARKIAATPPLSNVLGDELSPGPSVTSDDAIDAFVANDIQTEFHPANTLAMLPRNQGGVIDTKLRVYGLQNVRAVDASIFPVQFAAHMQWPVYSLAEHASEIIRAFHNGVADPDDLSSTPGGNNTNNNNNNSSTGNHHGGALSSSIPSVLTSAVALFAALAVVL
ncbi:GMC oxidoreductase [Thelephora ganbajun]|uniref:GMC oxidoreductase n=1 Tax=Thelephora ganbajun TaxID=370292 RepID=A0ACB6Z4E8_THEGA|nr:GMC oxidoreductase [Thelephora ganbajun]